MLLQEFDYASDDPDAIALRVNFDDAYLNGIRVIDCNAPKQLDWNSKSLNPHLVTLPEEFDISEHRDLLQPGPNVLALHLLNRDVRDTDMLMRGDLITYKMERRRANQNRCRLHCQDYPIVTADRLFNSAIPVAVFFLASHLTLATETIGTAIHFTTDGSQPNERSPIYHEPIRITDTTLVQALAIRPNLPRGQVTRAWFTKADTSLSDFSSDLPLCFRKLRRWRYAR